MAFLPEIENFITRPAKSGKPKTRDTIATYRGAFKRIFSKLEITEQQLIEASFSPEELVKRIEATDWEESTRLQTAKMVFMFLKDRKVDLPAITEYVDELEARKVLRRGEVRSDDEHEVHYADTVGKLEDVERAVDEFLQSQSQTPLRLSILLAAYLMLIVPLRPKEAVSIYIKNPKSENVTLSPNYLDLQLGEITISEQKSVKVGTRLIKVPERFVKLASLRTGWLFPNLRIGGEGQPMTRTDFTKQLVHVATLEFFGKSVSSRDLRTSVISNNIDTGMTPLEQAKFAKECGHTLATQIDHYNVFESVPNKPKITIRKKVEKSPPTEPISQQEPKPEPVQVQEQEQVHAPTSRTWNGDVYTLVDIPFAILEKVAELVPCEVRVTADCRDNKYSITLYDVNLKTYVAIERLFV